jgi:AcrR family transcriptional regulator
MTLQCKVPSMARTATPARARKPSQGPLNRDLIIDGARTLIEREGPGALSMRRLGAALGVEGMAIYHHFESRDALLTAIGDQLLEPLERLELGDDWREACRRFATTLRDLALAQPATFQLLGLQPLDTEFSLRAVERLVGVLVARGFAPATALAIYRATASYARGYALAEATGFTVDAAQPAGRKRLAALSRDDFPILAGRARELRQLDADAGYELGLQALLAGLPDPESAETAGHKPRRSTRRGR